MDGYAIGRLVFMAVVGSVIAYCIYRIWKSKRESK